jgi:hypothetical protein
LILAIEAALLRLRFVPTIRLVIPIAALVLLAIAFWQWTRS